TREILHRYLPDPPARILDVGGGTGVHASWLAEEGHSVHVVDVTPRHVENVRVELGPQGVTAELGDARELSLPDDSFDVALVFGPLYHLTDDPIVSTPSAKPDESSAPVALSRAPASVVSRRCSMAL